MFDPIIIWLMFEYLTDALVQRSYILKYLELLNMLSFCLQILHLVAIQCGQINSNLR